MGWMYVPRHSVAHNFRSRIDDSIIVNKAWTFVDHVPTRQANLALASSVGEKSLSDS
jgi:hypothetical protein